MAAIVVTGAAVRLTQAGLGCENWPSCSDERFVPEWSFHPWVEFGNRLLSGLVALSTAFALIGAYRRRPRRPDLIIWAWGLVAGVAAQIVIGGITVRVDLHPALVGIHFVVSMVLLWNAVVLWLRAGAGDSGATTSADSSVLNHARGLVVLATVVLLTGTVVTGTGPNSGDSRAERLDFELVDVARIHSITVWLFVATTVVLVFRLHRSGAPAAGRAVRTLLMLSVAQGGVGYLQYATGVPPLLVGLHIVGSISVWIGALLVHAALFERSPIENGVPRLAS